MNVLLSCAGRRNYLVEFFRQALAGRGVVFAADASRYATAMHEADLAFEVPRVDDPRYADVLLDISKQHHVRLLVGLNDLELPCLARNRERFLSSGTIPVVPGAAVVDVCFDKWATCEYLRSIGLQHPRTWISLAECIASLERREVSFPLVVKPRWGTSSIGVVFAHSMAELESAWQFSNARLQTVPSADLKERLVIQERLLGDEYGLDVINDLSGNYVATFVKRKLAMRAGETDRAITVEHPALQAVGRRLGEALKHTGILDCDVFADGDDCRVLEMNPRFGGGYPFSHAAGANILPAALIAWALGEPLAPDWLTVAPNVLSAKCDRIAIQR